MQRTLSVLAWCVAIGFAALTASASTAAAGERYWRHGGGGFVQIGGSWSGGGWAGPGWGGGWRGWGCSGGGTDCPTPINRPRWRGEYWGPGPYWQHGDPRLHYKYRGHRKHWRHPGHWGPHVYLGLGVPFVDPYVVVRPRRHVAVGINQAHVRWCKATYRTYRVSDNTFKPKAGKPRRQCLSPYL